MTNQKLLDKNKTKELDLEKDLLNFEISGISWIDGPEYQVDENRLKLFIKTLLTQQRTELLEKLLIKDPIGGFEHSFNNRIKEILNET